MVGGTEGMRGSQIGTWGGLLGGLRTFMQLKDILKKRKITGLCVKSRRFQIGNRDCCHHLPKRYVMLMLCCINIII